MTVNALALAWDGWPTGLAAAGFDALEALTGRLRGIASPLRAAAGRLLVLAGVQDTLVHRLV